VRIVLAQEGRSVSSEMDYRATVLVRRLESPTLAEGWGEVAAEALAAALEEGGLVQALRPRYAAARGQTLETGDVVLDDLRRDGDHWEPAGVDAYASGEQRVESREVSLPASEYVVSGTVSKMGEAWWVRATLRDRLARRALTFASASAEGDQGLLRAARAVAALLEPGYRTAVLERRSEAVLRCLRAGLLGREEAERRLEEMHRRWPAEVAPAAVRLLLAAEEEPPNDRTITAWAGKVTQGLPSAGPAGRRLMARLGLDPYDLLARACEREGRIEDAARAHREALDAMPGGRFGHLVELGRLEEALGRPDRAARAYGEALNLRPSDPGVRRNLLRLRKQRPARQDPSSGAD